MSASSGLTIEMFGLDDDGEGGRLPSLAPPAYEHHELDRAFTGRTEHARATHQSTHHGVVTPPPPPRPRPQPIAWPQLPPRPPPARQHHGFLEGICRSLQASLTHHVEHHVAAIQAMPRADRHEHYRRVGVTALDMTGRGVQMLVDAHAKSRQRYSSPSRGDRPQYRISPARGPDRRRQQEPRRQRQAPSRVPQTQYRRRR